MKHVNIMSELLRNPGNGYLRELKSKTFPGGGEGGCPWTPPRSSFRKSVSIYPRSALEERVLKWLKFLQWPGFCLRIVWTNDNYYASLSLSLLSSENVHAFTHVVLFVYHTGINLLTVHVFFNKWLVVSCGRQMFCCLHSSFLGELTLILLLLLFISATMQDFYILVLSLVFKENHYFILLEHPQN